MGVTGQATLARLTDQDASTKSFSTDTLAPPTNVAATPVGLTAHLTWTPSVDTYTAGYEIWRSTTSGSGYALVATASPGTAASANDAAGTGLFYYVLRSYFQNWRSVDSNETNVALGVGPVNTGPTACRSSGHD